MQQKQPLVTAVRKAVLDGMNLSLVNTPLDGRTILVLGVGPSLGRATALMCAAELARGLLFTEGVVQDNDDIEKITCSTACRERTDELINI